MTMENGARSSIVFLSGAPSTYWPSAYLRGHWRKSRECVGHLGGSAPSLLSTANG